MGFFQDLGGFFKDLGQGITGTISGFGANVQSKANYTDSIAAYNLAQAQTLKQEQKDLAEERKLILLALIVVPVLTFSIAAFVKSKKT